MTWDGGLLRVRSKRPRRHAAKELDELAPPHFSPLRLSLKYRSGSSEGG
jgi:hypothetical protein